MDGHKNSGFNADIKDTAANGQVVRNHDKRTAILMAAETIMSQKGVKNATIKDIASAAGVADSIIYHYFKNKEDLIFTLQGIALEKILNELEFQFQGIMGASAKLGKMVWYHLYMNDHGDARLRKNLLLECFSRRQFQKHQSFHTMKKYVHVLETILQEGILEGVFRSDLKTSVVRNMVFGLLDEEALLGIAEKNPAPTLLDFDQIISIIMAMITSHPGAIIPQDNDDKYTAILQAAKALFARKGFHDTTVSEIAFQAGVAEGTIYEYFQNKEDLLLSICKHFFELHKNQLDEVFTVESPSTKLRRLIWHHINIFAADVELACVFVKDIKFHKKFYKSDAATAFIAYHDKLSEVFEEGKRSGAFRKDVDTRIFRNLFIGSMSAMYTRWYFRETLLPTAFMEEMNHYVDLLCRAVASNPP